jgi:hypothetical protein
MRRGTRAVVIAGKDTHADMMRTPSAARCRHATLMPVLPAPDDATDYATRLLREAPSRYLPMSRFISP